MKHRVKRCSVCGEVKSIRAFYRVDTGRYGRRATCQRCYRAARMARYWSTSFERERVYKRAYSANARAQRLTVPGQITPQDIVDTWQASGGVCFYCGRELGRDWSIDHFNPLSGGGPNMPHNLRASCLDCNRAKGKRNPFVWLAQVSAQQRQARAA